MSLTIWVDADACPNLIKTVLFRAAQKRQLTLLLVANQLISTPPSKFIRAIRVSGGLDVADDYIVQHLQAGDLVITGDIPLAAQVIQAQGFVINPRGEIYDQNNIGEKLAMRDFMEGMRDSGLASGGPSAMTTKDVQNFSNAFDRFLTSQRI
jgi:uncharacterized protein YaiI (UPF0178 family)